MANNCYTTIKFTGSEEQLADIKNNIIKQDRFDRDTLSFNLVEKLLPGLRDKDLFTLLGCDYDKLILNRYSDTDIAQWHEKAEKFIADNKWIGFRNDYINNVWNFKIKKENNSLIIDLELPWYCPYNFFFFVAEKYNVQVSLVEKIEGNHTKIVFAKDDEICVVTNNFENSLQMDFVKEAINLNYMAPAEFLLAAIYNKKTDFMNELLNTYPISDNDIVNAVIKIKNLSEHDSNQESIFAHTARHEENFSNLIDSLSQRALDIVHQNNISTTTTRRFKF